MKIVRKIQNKVVLCLFLGVISACQEDIQTISEGTFVGTFKVREGQQEQTSTAKIILEGIHYNSQGQDNRIPAGGSGFFSVQEKVVAFTDTNTWTADFDWGLILNGTYQYTLEGKKLKLWKTSADGSKYYLYELEKQ